MSPLFEEKSTQWSTNQAEKFVKAARTLYEKD